VEKPLVYTDPSKHIKEFTLEQNLMHVNSVGNPSVGPLTLEYMKEVTVVRNPIYVHNVEKVLFFPVTLKEMGKFTVERRILHVSMWKSL
jgi:hypothetical protein